MAGVDGPLATDGFRDRAQGNELRRDLGRFGLLSSSASSMLTNGLAFASLGAATFAGPAALLSWALGGAAVLILAMAHAELSAMFPVAGGTVRFPRLAFGDLAGVVFGWASWLQAAAVAPYVTLGAESYAVYWWPALGKNPEDGQISVTGYGVAVALMALFTLVNFFGIRWFARVNNFLMVVKLAIPAVCFFILLTSIHVSNFYSRGFMPYGFKGVVSALGGGSIVFMFFGFEQADQLAGEARHPQRDIPFAVIGSVLIAIVLNVLAEVAFIGALPSGKLTAGFANLVPGGSGAPGLAGVLGIGWLIIMFRSYVLIAPLSNGLVYATTASRLSLGMARNRYVPAVFGRIDRRGVPWVGLISSFALSLFVFFPYANSDGLLGDIVGASVLMYAGTPLALSAMRRQFPDKDDKEQRPYRLPAARMLAPTAFTVANLMIYWSGWNVVWRIGLAVLAGCLLTGLTWTCSKSQRPSVITWRSALWVPVYLLGMGAISWQGAYSGGTGGIHFGWDILVVTVFSLAIYHWAVRSRLSAVDVARMVSDM
jgi:amino acid transporter